MTCCRSGGQFIPCAGCYRLEAVKTHRQDPLRTSHLRQFTLANNAMLAGDDGALDMIYTENNSDIKTETEERKLHRIAKVHNFLEMWLGCHISKKHFRPGGMPPSEWTRSVRAVRGNPVADYSAPSANTTRHIAYRPPIAVSVHACIWIAMQWVTLRKSLLTFLLH